jgi:hypothetical protein
LFILDIRNKDNRYKYNKTVFVYLAISAFTFIINKVYAIFGHGVSSDAMTWAFLYPLIGGALFFLLLGLLLPRINYFAGYRLLYNSYNSGIAVLTVGSLLKGVMEIAGTNSPYLKMYTMIGYGFMAFGLIVIIILAVNYKKVCPKRQ